MAREIEVPSSKRYSMRILGPIFHYYCASFHDQMRCLYEENPNRIVLYETRAGIRLKELYSQFLHLNNFEPYFCEKIFYTSRISTIKSCLYSNFDIASEMLLDEYQGRPIRELFQGLGFSSAEQCDYLDALTTEDFFRNLLSSQTSIASELRLFLENQSNLLDMYFGHLIAGYNSVVLVDSGWYGSTQILLMERYCSLEWQGVYYGKWKGLKSKKSQHDSMTGICVDDDRDSWFSSQLLSMKYYHLVEKILEGSASSVVGYKGGGGMEASPVYEVGAEYTGDSTNCSNDSIYQGIQEYINTHSTKKCAELMSKKNVKRIFFRLVIAIMFPSRGVVSMLAVDSVSSNMGKKGKVSVINFKDAMDNSDLNSRYKKSLWKSGQLALEWPRFISIFLQMLFLLKTLLKNYYEKSSDNYSN